MSTLLIATFMTGCTGSDDPGFGGGGTRPDTTQDSGSTGDTGGGDDVSPIIHSVVWSFEDAPNTDFGTNLVLGVDVSDPQDDVPGGVLALKLGTQEMDLQIDDGSGSGARDAYFENGLLVTNINAPEDEYEITVTVFDAAGNESNSEDIVTAE